MTSRPGYPVDRSLLDRALAQARLSAYPPGQYVDQESFMRADEISELARHADIGPDTGLLDLCCGIAGPGRLIARESGCRYLGVDADARAIEIARRRAGELDCRFEVSVVPPVPPGPHDVVLLLETILAFPDKAGLVAEIVSVLGPSGRLACTVEQGAPLTEAERAAMPAADTVWPIPWRDLAALLRENGLRVRWRRDLTRAHAATVDALIASFDARRATIAELVGEQVIEELLVAHRWWSTWLHGGRIRKIALIAQRS
jgi:SAM-dependent methyltransferase